MNLKHFKILALASLFLLQGLYANDKKTVTATIYSPPKVVQQADIKTRTSPGRDQRILPTLDCPTLFARLGILGPGTKIGEGGEFQAYRVQGTSSHEPTVLLFPKGSKVRERAPWQVKVREKLPTPPPLLKIAEPPPTTLIQKFVRMVWGSHEPIETTGHILPILQIDEQTGALLTKHVSSSLSDEIKKGRLAIFGLSSDRLQQLDFMDVILDALSELHENGVLHRDFKSSNILVEVKKVRGRWQATEVYIGDIGLAAIYTEGAVPEQATVVNQTQWEFPPGSDKNFLVGSPIYMGRDALRGMLTGQVDIFGAQITFLEVLFGKEFQSILPRESYYKTPVANLYEVPRLKGSLDRFGVQVDLATALLLHHPFMSVREFRELLGEVTQLHIQLGKNWSSKSKFTKDGLLNNSLIHFTQVYLKNSLLPLISKSRMKAVQTVFSSPMLIELFKKSSDFMWPRALKVELVVALEEFCASHLRDTNVHFDNTWLLWPEVDNILREYEKDIEDYHQAVALTG